MSETFIPKHGGYKNLITYQKAAIIYDATMFFCNRYVDRHDRTFDQMIQSARSGKQNIVEGSMASAMSTETEIKLTNVARACLEELLEDYRDFLRTRGHEIWDKKSKAAVAVRQLAGKERRGAIGTAKAEKGGQSQESQLSQASQGSQESYETYRPYIESRSAQTAANVIICLIHQTSYLLARQIKQMEARFVKEGGIRERMTRARLDQRDGKSR